MMWISYGMYTLFGVGTLFGCGRVQTKAPRIKTYSEITPPPPDITGMVRFEF